MSWVSSPDALLSSGWLSSAYAGHGILGAAIPTTGDSGGSPALNDGISPASEYRWELVSPPATGTVHLYEDMTFDYTDTANGFNTFTYRLYELGSDQGTATVLVQIGPSHTTITATPAGASATVASSLALVCAISAITAPAGGLLESFPAGSSAVTVSATTSDANGELASFSSATCLINGVTSEAVFSGASATGVCATAIHTVAERVASSLHSAGYVAPNNGLTLTQADINAIAAAVLQAIATLQPTTLSVIVENRDQIAADVWGFTIQ